MPTVIALNITFAATISIWMHPNKFASVIYVEFVHSSIITIGYTPFPPFTSFDSTNIISLYRFKNNATFGDYFHDFAFYFLHNCNLVHLIVVF